MDPTSETRPTCCPCDPASVVPSAATKDIEDQEWYHGFRPLSELSRLITKPGEFLVRATMSGLETIYMITVMMCNKKVVHVPLRKDSDNCRFVPPGEYCKYFDRMAFSTIADLINYCRIHPFSSHLKCEKVVYRPPWWVKTVDIAYVDRLGTSGQFYKGTVPHFRRRSIDYRTWKRKGGEAAVVIKKPIIIALMREARHMTSFKHDNVIQCVGMVYDCLPIILLTEFCAGGSLLRHLTTYGKDTDVKEKIIRLLASPISSMRSELFVMCALSTASFRPLAGSRSAITHTTNKYNLEDGIPDASLLNYIQKNARYCAPEAFGTPTRLQFSFKSDCWSFGMIVYYFYRSRGAPSKLVNLVGRIWKMSQRLAMADVALELHAEVKEICKGSDLTHKPMTVNKIHGVNRESFFELADTFDLEPSSGPSTDVTEGKRILCGK
uniref:Tyrosine-protein kinase n=1 Tax=Pristionchus pacificus TaxID=54126 RepID=A0A8R1YKJ3_PRIPA